LRVRGMVYFFFFFSSRRRHTRFSRDWSSDVCSSDLVQTIKKRIMASPPPETITPNPYLLLPQTLFTTSSCVVPCSSNFRFNAGKIGRASCRESEWIAVVAVALRLEDSDRRERCIGSE